MGNVVKSKGFLWFVVVAVILIFSYLLYGAGKKSSGFQKPKDLPQGGSGIPAGWKPTKLVDELWQYLDSWDWWEDGAINGDYREILMGKLLDLSEDQLTAVYNDYNYRWGKKDGNTSLTQKIKGEWLLDRKDGALNYLYKQGLE